MGNRASNQSCAYDNNLRSQPLPKVDGAIKSDVAQVPELLAKKLALGKITREEHDTILRAHALSTRVPTPSSDGGFSRGPSPTKPVAEMASMAIKVFCTTFNMGNAPLDPRTLHLWLSDVDEFDIIAVSLQETWGTARSGSRWRFPPTDDLASESSTDGGIDTISKSGSPPGKSGDTGSDSEDNVSTPASRTPNTPGTPISALSAMKRSNPRTPLKTPTATHPGTTVDIISVYLRGHTKCADVCRGQMRLLIFSKLTPRQPVHSIETSAENTGALFGTLPNKGGLVVRLMFGVTPISFVGCHLCAHEGNQHFLSRNSSCCEILQGARIGNQMMDISFNSHHCFFMGDLNYRINFDMDAVVTTVNKSDDNDDDDYRSSGRSAVVDHTEVVERENEDSGIENSHSFTHDSSNEELDVDLEEFMEHKEERTFADKFDLAQKLIDKGPAGLANLYKFDELHSALRNALVLRGFQTPEPKFPPTFKFVKREENKYNHKRIQSWCDRILWSSLDGLKPNVNLLDYASVPSIVSSDHKPVVAKFNLDIPTSAPGLDGGHSLDAVSIVVHLTKLSASNLSEMDGVLQGGMSDPYIEVFSDPAFVHPPESAARTKVVQKCLNPTWQDPLIVPLNTSSVRGVRLFLCVKDSDIGVADDIIGTACISLDRAFDPIAAATIVPNLEHSPVQPVSSRQSKHRRGALNTHETTKPPLDVERPHFAFSTDLLNNGICHGHLSGLCEVLAMDVSAGSEVK